MDSQRNALDARRLRQPLVGAKSRVYMQTNRHLKILGGGPNSLIMWEIKRQLIRGSQPNCRADQAVLSASRHLRDRKINVPQRNASDPPEPIWEHTGNTDQPIVIDCSDRWRDFTILFTEDQIAEAGIKDFASYVIHRQVSQALGRVPATRSRMARRFTGRTSGARSRNAGGKRVAHRSRGSATCDVADIRRSVLPSV